MLTILWLGKPYLIFINALRFFPLRKYNSCTSKINVSSQCSGDGQAIFTQLPSHYPLYSRLLKQIELSVHIIINKKSGSLGIFGETNLGLELEK